MPFAPYPHSVGFEEEVQADIRRALAEKASADRAIAAFRAAEPGLRAEARELLRTAVKVLRSNHVPTAPFYVGHVGVERRRHPRPTGVTPSGGQTVLSLMTRPRRTVYIDPAEQQVEAWDVTGSLPRWRPLLLLPEGRLVQAHRLSVGRLGPRGGERGLAGEHGICCCGPEFELSMCAEATPGHEPHLEFEAHDRVTGARIHGLPFVDWLRSSVNGLARAAHALPRSSDVFDAQRPELLGRPARRSPRHVRQGAREDHRTWDVHQGPVAAHSARAVMAFTIAEVTGL